MNNSIQPEVKKQSIFRVEASALIGGVALWNTDLIEPGSEISLGIFTLSS